MMLKAACIAQIIENVFILIWSMKSPAFLHVVNHGLSTPSLASSSICNIHCSVNGYIFS